MFENGKFPTIEELLERGKHLIQKAVDGKRLSGEETHFLELQNIWLAQRRDEQEKTARVLLWSSSRKQPPLCRMYSAAPNIPSSPSGALRFPLPPAGTTMTAQTTSAVVGLRQTTARPTRRCVAVWKE